MNVYNEVLEAVIRLVVENLNLYDNIVIGSLPPDNGISFAWGSGSLNTFLSKNSAVEMQAVLNGKNSNQEMVSDILGNIHVFLNSLHDYPTSDTYQITNIETIRPPFYLGREENSQWLYASSLSIKFYLKNKED